MGQDIRQLTGLRGFAAFLVFISHAANAGHLPSFLGLGLGQMGVMIFFILSGFLMGHLYLPKRPSKTNLLQFAAARIGRVVPLYWAVLLLSLILFHVIPNYRYDFSDPLRFAQAFVFLRGNYELWTIAVEVQFYVLFVVMWLVVSQIRPGALVALSIGALVASWGIAILGQAIIGRGLLLLPFSLPYFLTGMTISLMQSKVSSLRITRWGENILAVAALVGVFVTAPQALFELGIGPQPNVRTLVSQTWLHPLCYFSVTMLFLAVLRGPVVLSFFSSRPFIYMGTISYGFYLLHRPILDVFADAPLASPVVIAVVFAIVLALSALSFHYFERPVAQAIRALTRNRLAHNAAAGQT